MKVNQNPTANGERLALLEHIRRVIADEPVPWPDGGRSAVRAERQLAELQMPRFRPTWAHVEMQKAVNRAGAFDSSGSLVPPPQLLPHRESNYEHSPERWWSFAETTLPRTRERVRSLGIYECAVRVRRRTLTRLVNTWLAAGRDLDKWGQQNPQLAHKLESRLNTLGARVQLRGGVAFRLPWAPGTKDRPLLRLQYEAYQLFVELVQPGWLQLPRSSATLGRCERCGKLYVHQSGRRDRRHCSRDCAARDIVHEQRKQAKQARVELARHWYRYWLELKPRQDWKAFIVSRTREKVTQKFLTRNEQQIKTIQKSLNKEVRSAKKTSRPKG